MVLTSEPIVAIPPNAREQSRAVAAVPHFDILIETKGLDVAQIPNRASWEALCQRLKQAEMKADIEENSQ